MAKVNLSDLMSLRRSLMSLASLMLLMVLTTGIAGLFAVWSLSGLHLRTEKTLNEAAATLDHARSVQANFKTQVQEWKNILLRGHVAQDRASHLKAFEARKLKTTELLQALPARLERLEKMAGSDHERSAFRLPATINVPEQITALAQLNQAYDRALQAASAGDAWNPLIADGLLRGLDRAVSDRLDEIPLALLTASDTLLRTVHQAEVARFDTLSQAIWVAMLFALAMVALTLWRIFRHPALAR
jgi:hypothetical protein